MIELDARSMSDDHLASAGSGERRVKFARSDVWWFGTIRLVNTRLFFLGPLVVTLRVKERAG